MDCLNKQTIQDFHLVLIEDGTTDGTLEMVASAVANVSCLHGDGNLWWAGALQKGFDWLVEKGVPEDAIVLIMNNDCIVAPDFLQTGIQILAEAGEVLLLPQAYCRNTDNLIDAGLQVDWRRLKFEMPLSPDRINCLSTRGLFLTMGAFRKAGGFHPRLLPHYLSDYEFTIRACRRGLKLVCDPRLKLWMDDSSTGYHSISRESAATFYRKFFSKKCAMNPLYWASFVVLACPMRWKLRNILRVLFRGIKAGIRRKT